MTKDESILASIASMSWPNCMDIVEDLADPELRVTQVAKALSRLRTLGKVISRVDGTGRVQYALPDKSDKDRPSTRASAKPASTPAPAPAPAVPTPPIAAVPLPSLQSEAAVPADEDCAIVVGEWEPEDPVKLPAPVLFPRAASSSDPPSAVAFAVNQIGGDIEDICRDLADLIDDACDRKVSHDVMRALATANGAMQRAAGLLRQA